MLQTSETGLLRLAFLSLVSSGDQPNPDNNIIAGLFLVFLDNQSLLFENRVISSDRMSPPEILYVTASRPYSVLLSA